MKKTKAVVCLLVALVLAIGIPMTILSDPILPPIKCYCPYGCCGPRPTSIGLGGEEPGEEV